MRIKVNIPSPPVFTTELSVRVSDLNYSGHMGNDAVLSLTHEARVRYLAKLGVTELEIGSSELGLVMVDTAVEFKSEAFQSDQLTIAVSVDGIRDMAFDLYFEIKAQDGRLVAKVKSGHVAFDYSKRKLARFPEFFLQKLRSE